MNIYDNITYEDKTNLENLEKMIEVLVEYRYGNKEKFDDDKSFIESMLKIWSFLWTTSLSYNNTYPPKKIEILGIL